LDWEAGDRPKTGSKNKIRLQGAPRLKQETRERPADLEFKRKNRRTHARISLAPGKKEAGTEIDRIEYGANITGDPSRVPPGALRGDPGRRRGRPRKATSFPKKNNLGKEEEHHPITTTTPLEKGG